MPRVFWPAPAPAADQRDRELGIIAEQFGDTSGMMGPIRDYGAEYTFAQSLRFLSFTVSIFPAAGGFGSIGLDMWANTIEGKPALSEEDLPYYLAGVFPGDGPLAKLGKTAKAIEETTKTVGKSVGQGKVAFGPVPENAWSIFDRVSSKGSLFPGYKSGSTFANNGQNGSQILPCGDGITYREWDINMYLKGVGRGGERIVTGSNGTGYYTNYHYATFTQFMGSGR